MQVSLEKIDTCFCSFNELLFLAEKKKKHRYVFTSKNVYSYKFPPRADLMESHC